MHMESKEMQIPKMEQKIEITIPLNLLERIDKVKTLLGYRSLEEFMEAAVRRLLDQYTVLTSELHQHT